MLHALDGIEFAFHLFDGLHRKDSISGVMATDRKSAFSRCRFIFATLNLAAWCQTDGRLSTVKFWRFCLCFAGFGWPQEERAGVARGSAGVAGAGVRNGRSYVDRRLRAGCGMAAYCLRSSREWSASTG